MEKITLKLLPLLLISGLFLTGFTGCGEEESDKDEPLELPPASSLTMDLSAFGGGQMAPGAQLAGKNFTNAATRVLLLDAAVIVLLAPPVALFKAATNEIPEQQEDNSWLWYFTTTFLGHTYEAKLTGEMSGFSVLWSMKVTNSSHRLPLVDFEWYTGESALDNTSGKWQFYDFLTPDEKNETAAIDWSVASGKSELVFSNVDSRSPGVGDKLSYSVEGTTASISFLDASESETSEITWDLETIEGSIKVPGYNNGERAYWDENKQNIVPE